MNGFIVIKGGSKEPPFLFVPLSKECTTSDIQDYCERRLSTNINVFESYTAKSKISLRQWQRMLM